MKKFLKIAGIILLIILIIFIIYKISTYKEKQFNKFPFETYHHIINTTNITYIDTIVHSGIQSLNIDSVIIIIKPLIEKQVLLPEDLETKAYIQGKGYQYLIFIGNYSREENIQTLSHELIHLKQYYRNELILIDNGKTPIWKGDTINIKDYKYENRPWEKEAYDNSSNLASKMKLLLYGK